MYVQLIFKLMVWFWFYMYDGFLLLVAQKTLTAKFAVCKYFISKQQPNYLNLTALACTSAFTSQLEALTFFVSW